jgi:hypothetical protein
MRNLQGPSISESQLTPGTEPLRRLLTLVGSQRASSFRSKKVTQFTIVVNCYVQINTGCQQAGVPGCSADLDNVRPPARAWLTNVCRPWWIVCVRSRAKPKNLQAVRNLRRSAARCSGLPSRCDCTEQTNGSLPRAPCSKRSPFHVWRSANVPASHQRGTHRARRPLVISRRSRRCGRWTSITTSSS